MKSSSCVILVFTILTAIPANGYRIFGIFPINVHSHFVMFERLMKGLAERGHQVDVVSHFPLKKPFPNYNDAVSLAGTMPDVTNNMTLDMLKAFDQSGSNTYHIASVFGTKLCDFMDLPKFKKLIKNPPKNPPYDLVIAEVSSIDFNCQINHADS